MLSVSDLLYEIGGFISTLFSISGAALLLHSYPIISTSRHCLQGFSIWESSTHICAHLFKFVRICLNNEYLSQT